jgi:hypothetical protein
VAESEKAKANREVKCEHVEKLSCCYVCPSRLHCAISCKYLGSPEASYVPVAEKAPTDSTIDRPKEHIKTVIANDQVKYCLVCSVEMSEAKTELRVDDWKGHKPNMSSADMLPVVIYLCPRCGKIELKADRQQSKD